VTTGIFSPSLTDDTAAGKPRRGRRAATFKQRDVKAAIAAAFDAGATIARVEIDDRLVIVASKATEPNDANALDQWMAKNARPA
jgi:hypothetical protein